MPGPMIACDRSTGATGERSSPAPFVISSSASGRTWFSSRRNARREVVTAFAGRGRQTRTMLEARALVPHSRSCGLPLGAHRPGAGDGEARRESRRRETFPTLCWLCRRRFRFGLLERVVDRDGEGWVRLLGEALHRLESCRQGRTPLPCPCRRDGKASRLVPRPSGQQAWQTDRETRSSVTDAAKRRRSLTGRRSRCCRSRADQWRQSDRHWTCVCASACTRCT